MKMPPCKSASDLERASGCTPVTGASALMPKSTWRIWAKAMPTSGESTGLKKLASTPSAFSKHSAERVTHVGSFLPAADARRFAMVDGKTSSSLADSIAKPSLFSELPAELVVHIGSFLPAADLGRLAMVDWQTNADLAWDTNKAYLAIVALAQQLSADKNFENCTALLHRIHEIKKLPHGLTRVEPLKVLAECLPKTSPKPPEAGHYEIFGLLFDLITRTRREAYLGPPLTELAKQLPLLNFGQSNSDSASKKASAFSKLMGSHTLLSEEDRALFLEQLANASALGDKCFTAVAHQEIYKAIMKLAPEFWAQPLAVLIPLKLRELPDPIVCTQQFRAFVEDVQAIPAPLRAKPAKQLIDHFFDKANCVLADYHSLLGLLEYEPMPERAQLLHDLGKCIGRMRPDSDWVEAVSSTMQALATLKGDERLLAIRGLVCSFKSFKRDVKLHMYKLILSIMMSAPPSKEQTENLSYLKKAAHIELASYDVNDWGSYVYYDILQMVIPFEAMLEAQRLEAQKEVAE